LLTVTVIVSVEGRWFESPARIAETPQVTPPRDEVSEVPDSTQFPEVTDHETDPDVCPPEAVRVWVDPVVKEVALVIENPDCGALSMVIARFAESAWL
jgi:hypothetical protein